MAQDNLDAPPPPYSETDIYSNSGRVYSNPSVNPSVAGGDDHTSTTTSERILTPPDTPRTNSGSQLPRPSQPHHAQHGHGGVNTSGFAEAAAAAAVNVPPAIADYFSSRSPPPADLPADGVVHTIRIDQNTLPDNLPYHHDWAARDVLPQDWATFVNFLIPDHATRGNQAVLDRKIEAERQSEAGSDAKVASRTGSEEQAASVSPLSQAEAQRDNLHDSESGHSEAEQTNRMFNAAVTVQQWNEGFFGPRKMTIHMDGLISQERIPGFGDAASNQSVGGSSYVTATDAQDASAGAGGWGKYFNGGLRVNADGIRFGNSFVADSNGLRIGSLIMDSNGIRVGASRDNPGQSSQNPNNEQSLPTGRGRGRDLGIGSGGGGRRGRGGFAREQIGSYRRGEPSHRHHWSDHRHSWDHHHHHDHDHATDAADSHHHHHHHGKGGEAGAHDHRGRHHVQAHHETRRDASVSSISSSSSSSSSSSDGSIGSLPAYDDIQPQALPAYVARLEAWLAQPDHEFTKADVKTFKSEIKAVKALPIDASVDIKALRLKAKEFRNQWKQVKRQQRRTRREKRRDRRNQRRAERRERRDARREMKRSRKEVRKGKRSEPVPNPPMPAMPSMPPMPAMPAMPAMPSMPSAHSMPGPPPNPPMPHGHSGFGPAGGLFMGRGAGRGWGRDWGRGWGGGRAWGRSWDRDGDGDHGGGPSCAHRSTSSGGSSGGCGPGRAAGTSSGPFKFAYSSDSPKSFGFSVNTKGAPDDRGHSSHSRQEHHHDGHAVAPQSATTQRLYARVCELETQIYEIEEQSRKLQAQMDEIDTEAGGIDARAKKEALRSAKAGLDKQIEVLAEQLENAGARADEEFAKEMDSSLHI